ncbi:hypothetical protein LTR78_002286 [Recurvomyces mirabilis]|uniref:Uncharacterized protein n=1 Tax=Recurvomyces mirabilis TaxID=574656 RepID=A0AAE0WU31_9PEZI|nr:hypothetical protein LTR78_002286 [Recurvomyces mirabilis]KAK5160741.1 hypothetical protein LTS14_001754 [Recurvomyces mirabilis]
MHTHARVFSKDEELGKRDDDFKSKRLSASNSFSQPWRWRKRRLFSIVAIAALLYLAYIHLAGNIGSVRRRRSAPSALRSGGIGGGVKLEPTGAPPRPVVSADDEESSKHYFDGQIKFYRLAATLHEITRTMGSRPQNRNVLYAVSSLHSAANLIPMACEMAKWDRNYVHIAFLGRDSLPLDDILEVNSVDRNECSVFFHDARGDYNEYSTDKRAEVAVAGAMKHINDFMHPQAIIMDDSKVEDKFFTRAIRGKAMEMDRPLIEVPTGRYEEFLWMTRLDAGSLSNWFKPTIEILVHAPSDSAGGLIRLIRSLEGAEYSGFAIPKLTVELPSTIEPFAKRYLERLAWPPGREEEPWQSSLLSLRHRIPAAHLDSEQASVRFVESFYPSNRENNHVLVLSTQADVGPLFMQYLMYAILEYKYSTYGAWEAVDLLGVSLDVPSTFLNASTDFVPPRVHDMSAGKYTNAKAYNQADETSFLYQAPSAAASLIFGDKWSIFHDFLAKRLTASRLGTAEKKAKLIPESEPAWLEYLLELMRARGWSMLHPSVPFVTVHNELAQLPEEFMRAEDEAKATKATGETRDTTNEPFLTATETPAIAEHTERQTPDYQPLHHTLAFEGDLPELSHLPYLSHEGKLVDIATMMKAKEDVILSFRRQIGGCQDKASFGNHLVPDETRTDDLFCLPGKEAESEEGIELEEVSAEELAHEGIAQTTPTDEDDDDDTTEAEVAMDVAKSIPAAIAKPQRTKLAGSGDAVG